MDLTKQKEGGGDDGGSRADNPPRAQLRRQGESAGEVGEKRLVGVAGVLGERA